MRDRVRIRDLEPALLQIVAVIQNGAADKECAFRIDNYVHAGAFDENVPVSRAIDQIHFVLQPRAPAADHGQAKRAVLPALLFKQ